MNSPGGARPSIYLPTFTHGELYGHTQLAPMLLARAFKDHGGFLELRAPERKPTDVGMGRNDALRYVSLLLCMAAAFVDVSGAEDHGFHTDDIRDECKRLGIPDTHTELPKLLRGQRGLIVPEGLNPLVRLALSNGASLSSDPAVWGICHKALTRYATLMEPVR